MKKTYLLICIGFLFSITNLDAKNINGTIFYEDHAVDVIFKIPTVLLATQPDYFHLQYKVKYIDKDGKTKLLSPKDAKEIRFTFQGEKIRMLSRANKNNIEKTIIRLAPSSDMFLKVRELRFGGKIKLFNLYVLDSNNIVVRKDVFQKEGEELFRYRSLFFKKDMILYFDDCPELVEAIKNKEFDKRDAKYMADFYNEKCK